ncbi:MAG TPA: APC family permease [Novosphingobium sp.]|nr:APC family permease [Novosphingobium sp.]
MTHPSATPRRHLGVGQASLLALGMILSTDTLKTASTVALNVGHWHFYGLWVLGGLISMAGALCYVEMAAAFPDAGGEYSFLRRAWGPQVGALFAWSRFAIMHTGWIALMAYMFADYASALLHMGHTGQVLFAMGTVAALTALNLADVRLGFLTQALLVVLVAAGFASVVAAGLVVAPAPALPDAGPRPPLGDISAALIYIFLAYGGWSDAATLSAEVRARRHGMLVASIGSIAMLIAIYVAINWALMRGLGANALAHSAAPAAQLCARAFGPAGAALIVGVVGISAIASINSTLIVGARTTYAAARDMPGLGFLGQWHPTRGTPARAVLAEGGFALLLTAAASLTESGFNTMVNYMTPVYWLFILLSMAAMIRLRLAHPEVERPVRTPLFPLFPLGFMAMAGWMLYAAFTQLGAGALFGAGVLALGIVPNWLMQRRHPLRTASGHAGDGDRQPAQ